MNSRLPSSETVLKQIAAIVSGCSYDPRRDMHFIDPKTVPGWNAKKTGYWIPNCIDSVCGNPECCRAISFVPEFTGHDFEKAKAIITVATCSGCQQQSEFILTGIKKSNQPEGCGGIWQNPAPKLKTLIVDTLPIQRIFLAYKNAIEAFNKGMWSLSIGACGRVVEGIAKTTFPKAKETRQIGKLFNKLRTELKTIDEFRQLLDPLLGLGEALRIGRNEGDHFDLEVEPDRELANKVIDLTEFLIQYVYLIADEADEINKLIAKLKPNDTEEENLAEADLRDETSEADPSPRT